MRPSYGLLLVAASALQQSALHEAVRLHRAEHRAECDVAAARYRAPPRVVADAAAVEDALARGGYRDADVWAAERVFSRADARALVEEIDAQDDGWSTNRHKAWQSSRAVADLPLRHLPGATAWLAERFASTVAPLVARVVPGVDAEDLRVADAFVVRYVHEAGEAASLPTHVDGGLVSVNIGLNDAFEGGGTRFERTGRVVRGGEGSVVIHPSAVRHAGEPITSGVRVILVVFCISRRAPELCRRFTNEGIAAGARGDAAASTLAFRRATKFDAANVAARQNLAANRFNAGGFDGLKAAATDLHRCVALEGGDACRNVDVLARLGEAAHALGAYAQALAVSSWLLDVAPEDFCGHVLRVSALASLLATRDAAARAELRSALADAGACARSAEHREALAALAARAEAALAKPR